jgi:hypothetical protein
MTCRARKDISESFQQNRAAISPKTLTLNKLTACIIWEDKNKMYLRETRCIAGDPIQQPQVRVQWQTCEHGNEPSNSTKPGKWLTNRVNVTFSTKIMLYEC